MIGVYESALVDLPIEELRAALNQTLREEKFWPTPGHVFERWSNNALVKDKAEAELAWNGVLGTINKIGRVYSGGFDSATEHALRSIGGYLALCNDIPEADHRFVRKNFIDAYCRYRETSGYLAPTRAEAQQVLDQMPKDLVEKAFG